MGGDIAARDDRYDGFARFQRDLVREEGRDRSGPGRLGGELGARVEETEGLLQLVFGHEDDVFDAFSADLEAMLACEPAAAVPVAALLAGKIALQKDETVVAVVSGGNVATETAVAILAGQ